VILSLAVAIGCNRTTTEKTTPPSTPTAGIDRHSDAQLATAVQARFYQDDAIRGGAIDVSAQNGTVTLRGTVPSQETKQQALTLARSVQGVTSVDDELTVSTTSSVPGTSAGSRKRPRVRPVAPTMPRSPAGSGRRFRHSTFSTTTSDPGTSM
jgi:hypothetical protein